jgi:hypothetical protein
MMPPIDAPDMTVLAEGAAQTHELFTAYVEAGFTRREALELVSRMIAATITENMRQQRKEGGT